VWRGAKQIAAFWCFCKESTSLHVTIRTDIYSGFLLILYNNITSFFNIIIFFLYFTFIILTIYTWYSITCSCFTRVLVIALAFTYLLYSFAWYSTCCFALFILLDIRSCRVSFLWLRSAPLQYPLLVCVLLLPYNYTWFSHALILLLLLYIYICVYL